MEEKTDRLGIAGDLQPALLFGKESRWSLSIVLMDGSAARRERCFGQRFYAP
jgi:hypothetical protein